MVTIDLCPNHSFTSCILNPRSCIRRVPQAFIDHFTALQNKHKTVLRPPATRGNRKRQRIRLAYRFVENNMHRIFTFRDIPDANIPTTTNHLEGMFSHIKERVNIHRGLQQETKKKAVKFLIKNF